LINAWIRRVSEMAWHLESQGVPGLNLRQGRRSVQPLCQPHSDKVDSASSGGKGRTLRRPAVLQTAEFPGRKEVPVLFRPAILFRKKGGDRKQTGEFPARKMDAHRPSRTTIVRCFCRTPLPSSGGRFSFRRALQTEASRTFPDPRFQTAFPGPGAVCFQAECGCSSALSACICSGRTPSRRATSARERTPASSRRTSAIRSLGRSRLTSCGKVQ